MANGMQNRAGNVVAVAPDLGPVREALRSRGYTIEDLPVGRGVAEAAGDWCAIVITGLDDDLLGEVSMQPDVPVLRAEGKTPDQVAEEVEAIRAAQRVSSGTGIS